MGRGVRREGVKNRGPKAKTDGGRGAHLMEGRACSRSHIASLLSVSLSSSARMARAWRRGARQCSARRQCRRRYRTVSPSCPLCSYSSSPRTYAARLLSSFAKLRSASVNAPEGVGGRPSGRSAAAESAAPSVRQRASTPRASARAAPRTVRVVAHEAPVPAVADVVCLWPLLSAFLTRLHALLSLQQRQARHLQRRLLLVHLTTQRLRAPRAAPEAPRVSQARVGRRHAVPKVKRRAAPAASPRRRAQPPPGSSRARTRAPARAAARAARACEVPPRSRARAAQRNRDRRWTMPPRRARSAACLCAVSEELHVQQRREGSSLCPRRRGRVGRLRC